MLMSNKDPVSLGNVSFRYKKDSNINHILAELQERYVHRDMHK